MQKIFLILFCLTVTGVMAQTDTLYYYDFDRVSKNQPYHEYEVLTYLRTSPDTLVDVKRYKDNVLKSEGTYLSKYKRTLYNEAKSYSPKGNILTHSLFTNAGADQDFKSYYKNGKLRRHETWHDKKLVTGECYDTIGKIIPFFDYSVPATFKGGNDSLAAYLVKNIKYPKYCKDKNIEGKVWIRFEVDKKGNIKNAHIRRSAHPYLDEEAMRVVRAMPLWTPGLQEGEPVTTSYMLPVKFTLQTGGQMRRAKRKAKKKE